MGLTAGRRTLASTISRRSTDLAKDRFVFEVGGDRIRLCDIEERSPQIVGLLLESAAGTKVEEAEVCLLFAERVRVHQVSSGLL